MKGQATERVVVAIGVFDGVHLGHQALLNRVTEASEREEALSGVITFDPPPLAVLEPTSEPFQITLLSKKKRLLTEFGVQRVLVIPATAEFLALPAEDFIEQVLLNEMNPAGVVVGHDFRFGAGGAGSIEQLKAAGSSRGFWVDELAPVTVGEQRVSSTRIRREIGKGRIAEATEMLGRLHTVTGRVVSGEGIGARELVPTANLSVDPAQLLPAAGVYAVTGQIEGSDYAGVANVGRAPTLGTGHDRLVEVHWLDFSGDLRGQDLEIGFSDWLRDQTRYKSIAELGLAIESDIMKVRQKLILGSDNHLAPGRGI